MQGNIESVAEETDGAAAVKQKPETNWRLASIATLLLLLASVMIFVSGSTYLKGIAAQQYKIFDATVERIDQHFDPIGIRKEAVMRFSPLPNAKRIASVPIPFGRVLKRGESTVVFSDPSGNNAVLSQEIDYDTVIVMGAFGFFALSFGILIAKRSKKPA